MTKTALVLSAGGMFGAYQAGAWKAIAELAPPDIVVGASVGALNGWPIAGGCSPDHLIERWLDPAAGDALQLFPDYGWGFLGKPGWFDPAPLRAQAESIWRDYQPRIPFGLVVTELPRLHARLVRYPNVSAAHLQATCSIPLFLPSVGSAIWTGGFSKSCRSGRRSKWAPRELSPSIHCPMSENGGCIWGSISRMRSSPGGDIRGIWI
jgi:predicted acylesterase/phospholipase RssA